MDELRASVRERFARARVAVEHVGLRADDKLPFDDERFDTVVTTWTLCSIPRPSDALVEMRRVLKPSGRYLFVEHGRSDVSSTAIWQDRVNPIWRRISDGCNINRPIASIVREAGFELAALDRFRGCGPRIFAEMNRGGASRV